jgi:hypothetical protein
LFPLYRYYLLIKLTQKIDISLLPQMDDMIDAEENCIYCQKYLYGLNDFNKKMHLDTCKVRKMVDSSPSNPLMNGGGGGQQTGSNSTGSSTSSSASSSSSENNSTQHNAIEESLIAQDNCIYCFKSFKVRNPSQKDDSIQIK